MDYLKGVCKLGLRPVCTALFGTQPGRGLLSINTETGEGTFIGDMGFLSTPSLAIDPTTGIMYAGRGDGNPNLYTVDPNTGATTLVSDTGLGLAAIPALDFRSDGTLFASVNIAGAGGTGGDHLAIIDKNTASTTIIGSFGTCTGVTVPSTGGGTCTIEGMEAIAFSPTGILFGASRGSATNLAGLYMINTSTGAATFHRPIENPDGSTPSSGVVSLQFCGKILFGGTATSDIDGGRLIIIDPATGFWSFVGSGSATTDGVSLGGLAGITR
jgi:hypothetical protein